MHDNRNGTKKSLTVGVAVAFVATAVVFGLVAVVAPLAHLQSAQAQSNQTNDNSTAMTNSTMTNSTQNSTNSTTTMTAPPNSNNTSSAPTANGNATATTPSEPTAAKPQGRMFVAQKTGISAPDPLPGHSMHQMVMVVPPRADGKIWDGDVSWTSSQPVEVVILHMYNSTGVDDKHGEPLNAALPDGSGNKVAITLYKDPSDTPAPSGSTHFTGTALAFHTLDGKPFTVTYSVKAVAYIPQ